SSAAWRKGVTLSQMDQLGGGRADQAAAHELLARAQRGLENTPASITNPTARSALICVRSVGRSSVMEHDVASPHFSREVERDCAKKRTIGYRNLRRPRFAVRC